MRLLFAVGAWLAAVLWSLPASADWEFAKWGMTRPQLIAASNGKASECGPGRGNCFLDIDIAGCTGRVSAYKYPAFGLTFLVNFGFDDKGKLACIELRGFDPEPRNFDKMKDTFRKLYGAPGREGDRELLWTDPAGNNSVRLLLVRGLWTIIHYRPSGK